LAQVAEFAVSPDDADLNQLQRDGATAVIDLGSGEYPKQHRSRR
jgi:hypothetical protein